MSTPTKDTILVTGASGHLGRAVIAHLIGTYKVPAGQIIAATRKPEGLADLAEQGVRCAQPILTAPILAKSFAGAKRLLLISTDAVDRPGRRLEQHLKAVKAAKEAGRSAYRLHVHAEPVRRIHPSFSPGDHSGTEEAIATSGMTHTILRNSWYMENLAMSLPSAHRLRQMVFGLRPGQALPHRPRRPGPRRRRRARFGTQRRTRPIRSPARKR